MDALLNYETVALFGNAPLEVRAYDKSLTAYQRSVVRLDWAAAALNAGQAALLAAGMTGAMLAAALSPARAAAGAAGAAAAGAAAGITAGDLVMIQGLLLQLWAPLQFLVRTAQRRACGGGACCLRALQLHARLAPPCR